MKYFMLKLRWAWIILRATSFVAVTERGAAISIPIRDPEELEDVAKLSLQQSVLEDFREKLDEVILVHSEQVRLQSRKDKKTKAKAE